MKATRVRGSSIPAQHYQCARCGIIWSFNHRRKPVYCGDCLSVERLMARMAAAA